MQQFKSPREQYNSILSMLQLMDDHLQVNRLAETVVSERPRGAEPGSALRAPQGQRPREPRTANATGRRAGAVKPATRFRMRGKVVIHKNDRYVKGMVLNISKSGLFVYSDCKIFNENEVVRLSIRPQGSDKYYKAIARVVRFNENSRYVKGYGLKFIVPKKNTK